MGRRGGVAQSHKRVGAISRGEASPQTTDYGLRTTDYGPRTTDQRTNEKLDVLMDYADLLFQRHLDLDHGSLPRD
jgi:hypothetical protein